MKEKFNQLFSHDRDEKIVPSFEQQKKYAEEETKALSNENKKQGIYFQSKK